MAQTLWKKQVAHNIATSPWIISQVWISINGSLQNDHALIISLDLCQIHLHKKSAFKVKTNFNLRSTFLFLKICLVFWKFSNAQKSWINSAMNTYTPIITIDQLLTSYPSSPFSFLQMSVANIKTFHYYFNVNRPKQGHLPT